MGHMLQIVSCCRSCVRCAHPDSLPAQHLEILGQTKGATTEHPNGLLGVLHADSLKHSPPIWPAPSAKSGELLLHNSMQATNHTEHHFTTPDYNLNMQAASHLRQLTTHEHDSQHCGDTLDPLANKTCHAQSTWSQWI